MIRGQPYSECRLYYDGSRPLEVGYFLRTPADSAYRVQKITPHRTRAYRQNLVCLRVPVADIPNDAVVLPLHWYKRTKRRARPLGELSAYR